METRGKRKSETSQGALPQFSERDKRVAIFVQFRLGVSVDECHQLLSTVFDNQAPSLSTVKRWFARFKLGLFDLDDQPSTGRPISSITDRTIALVKQMVDEDRRVTVQEIEKEVGIAHSTVLKILHDELKMRKLCARWVPHQLSEDNIKARLTFCNTMLERFDAGSSKDVSYIVTGDETFVYNYDPETKEQSKQWVPEKEGAPTKFARQRSVGKIMIAVFFRRSGILEPIVLEPGQTVTAQWYSETCLPKLIDSLRDERPRTGEKNLLLHQDNAPAHQAKLTQNFLKLTGFQVLPHPAYSPDLAPCDFFLFPKIKKNLKGKRFQSREEVLNAVNAELKAVKIDDLNACFTNWFYRMKKCINCNGSYFEKM